MPSATHELELFAKDALSRGLGRDEIRQVMLAAGWTEEQIGSALGAYADVPFPVPVPRARPQLSAREAFLYLLMFGTLYTSAWSLGSLLFHIINHAYPDPTVREWGMAESMRWSMANLIIAFPVFAFLARHIARDLARSPVKRLSPVRRWLTYITLLIAAAVLIGDLATLVYELLGGELSVRISLKVLVAGLISGAILGYYLWDLRHEERE